MALETVNLNSLFEEKESFNFNLDFEGFFSSFLIKFLVACCSANFLAKLLLKLGVGFGPPVPAFDLLVLLNGLKGAFF